MDFFNEMHLCVHMWFQVLCWTLCNDYWKCTYDATIAFVLGNKQVLYDYVQSKCNIPYDVFIHSLCCFVLFFWVVCERLRADWGRGVFRFLCFLSMNYWPKPFFLNTVIKCSSLNFPSLSITPPPQHTYLCWFHQSSLHSPSLVFRFFTAVKSGCYWAQVSGHKCLRDESCWSALEGAYLCGSFHFYPEARSSKSVNLSFIYISVSEKGTPPFCLAVSIIL